MLVKPSESSVQTAANGQGGGSGGGLLGNLSG